MRVAIVGSRGLPVTDLQQFLPEGVTQIVSGGAKGVDTWAKEYALAKGIPLVEFLPEYSRYGRAAPLKRNLQIISQADQVLAFWDGASRGTKFVIDQCRQLGIPIQVWIWIEGDWCIYQEHHNRTNSKLHPKIPHAEGP